MKERKVLVIFCDADLYGASKNLIRSLEGFRRIGLTPITVLPFTGPLIPRIEELGFEVIVMDHGILRRQNLSPKGIFKFASQITSSFWKLSKLIKHEKIHLIYSNSNANFIGGLLRIWHGIPHIWHIHEIIKHPRWFKSFLENYIKISEDRVFCVSKAVINNFSTIDESHLKLLYNGIDTQPFLQPAYDLKAELGIPKDKILIGMIARVNHWKGQSYFLEIAALLKKRYPNLHFVMAGDVYPGYEYLYDELQSQIQRLDLEMTVTNLGFRLDVPEILSGLDIFVLPSILPDPLPTTVLEAMAAARPVIATNHGGATEMVLDQKTGFLIPWDDASTAALAFEKLIESSELRSKMGDSGRDRVSRQFNRENYLENFGKLVSELLEEKIN